MKWSWRIGTLMGIVVRVHATFPLLLAWIALLQLRSGATPAAVAYAVGFLCTVFLIVLMHEYGHALTARRFGIGTRDITLLPIGGLARLERMPREPRQELAVALAGPAVNVVLAALLFLVLLAVDGPASMPIYDAAGGYRGHLSLELPALTSPGPWLAILGFVPDLERDGLVLTARLAALQLVAINVWLVLFNMLPAFPMDGGRVLRALLAWRLRNHTAATVVAARVGRVFALLFGALGLFVVSSPTLVLIALFIWVAGAAESSAVETSAALEGVTLADLMITDLRVLAPGDSLAHAAQLVIDGFQHDFPVLQEGRLVGMLGRAELVQGLATVGASAPVAAVMRTDMPVASDHDTVDDALGRMTDSRRGAMPVLRGATLVGLLTTENVMEYLLLRRATAPAERRATS